MCSSSCMRNAHTRVDALAGMEAQHRPDTRLMVTIRVLSLRLQRLRVRTVCPTDSTKMLPPRGWRSSHCWQVLVLSVELTRKCSLDLPRFAWKGMVFLQHCPVKEAKTPAPSRLSTLEKESASGLSPRQRGNPSFPKPLQFAWTKLQQRPHKLHKRVSIRHASNQRFYT